MTMEIWTGQARTYWDRDKRSALEDVLYIQAPDGRIGESRLIAQATIIHAMAESWLPNAHIEIQSVTVSKRRTPK